MARGSLSKRTHRCHSDDVRNLGLDTLDVVNLRVGGVTAPSDASIEAPLTVLVDLKRQGLFANWVSAT